MISTAKYYKRTAKHYSVKPSAKPIYNDLDLLVYFRHLKPSSVSQAIRSQYDRLSTLDGFHTQSRFVLELFPGLVSVLQFSEIRCYYIDVVEPLGDRLLKYQGCSLARQTLGRSDFCYHTLAENFTDLPELFYDKIVCSEVHKLRGSPLIEQAIDSLTIGGKIFVYGGLDGEIEQKFGGKILRTACSVSAEFPDEDQNFVEYLKLAE